MRTIWKMSSAEPAANYPAEPSTNAQGGLHPVQAAGAEPDFMVDDEDDGFEWNSAQPPERTPDETSTDAAAGRDPDPNPTFPDQLAEPDAIALEEPAPPTELTLIAAAAPADAEQPELDAQPTQAGQAALAEQPVLADQRVPAQHIRSSGKAPSWRWPAAMALLVVVVVALLFFVRERLDAPRTAAPPVFAEQPLEPDAGFPTSPVFEPAPLAPLQQVQSAPPPPPPLAAPTAAPRSAPPKQKASAAQPQSKRQRPPRRAQAQQPAAAPADAISCILPGGQEVQASYPSCRSRGGVIYR